MYICCLPANDVAVGQTPVVITNSSPDSVKVDFYAAFEWVTALVETSVVVYGEADSRSIWYYVADWGLLGGEIEETAVSKFAKRLKKLSHLNPE